MATTKVWIEEGCIACGMCADICLDVFTMKDHATVIEGVNYSDFEKGIKEAIQSCPVDIIKYSE